MRLGQPPLTDVPGLSPSTRTRLGRHRLTYEDVATSTGLSSPGGLLEPAQMREMKNIVSERTGKPVPPVPEWASGSDGQPGAVPGATAVRAARL